MFTIYNTITCSAAEMHKECIYKCIQAELTLLALVFSILLLKSTILCRVKLDPDRVDRKSALYYMIGDDPRIHKNSHLRAAIEATSFSCRLLLFQFNNVLDQMKNPQSKLELLSSTTIKRVLFNSFLNDPLGSRVDQHKPFHLPFPD